MMDKEKLIEWIERLKLNNNMHSFYISGVWKRKKTEILKRDRYDCVCCKSRGRYSRADTVHHVMHLRTHPSLALTNSNLISVCRYCHDNIFHPKFKPKEKAITPERW